MKRRIGFMDLPNHSAKPKEANRSPLFLLISATNYFRKDESVPMRSPAGSYSMVLLRRVVAGKVETQLMEGEFYPKAYTKAPEFNAAKCLQCRRSFGSGW